MFLRSSCKSLSWLLTLNIFVDFPNVNKCLSQRVYLSWESKTGWKTLMFNTREDIIHFPSYIPFLSFSHLLWHNPKVSFGKKRLPSLWWKPWCGKTFLAAEASALRANHSFVITFGEPLGLVMSWLPQMNVNLLELDTLHYSSEKKLRKWDVFFLQIPWNCWSVRCYIVFYRWVYWK